MAGCLLYGEWQYEQHSGHKTSQHTQMSSVPELHIYNLLGANTDSRNKEENQNMAEVWSLHQALGVFCFSLISSSRPRVHSSVG